MKLPEIEISTPVPVSQHLPDTKNSFVLSSIHLKRFKKFKDLSLSFGPGLNVISGPNEQGKSSLLAGILAGLFFNPESKAGYIKHYKSWNTEELYEIELGFIAQGKEFLIKKDFEHNTCLLKALDGSIHFDTFEQSHAFISSALGFSNLEVFLASGCVRQDQLTQIRASKKDLSASLERSLTAVHSKRTATEALSQIAKAQATLRKGLKTQTAVPGPLKEVQDRIAVGQERLAQLTSQSNAYYRAKASLEQLINQSETLRKEFEEQKRLVQAITSYKQTEQRRTQISTEFERIQHDISEREHLQREIEFMREKQRNLGSFTLAQLAAGQDELEEIQRQQETDRAAHEQALQQAAVTKKKTTNQGIALIVVGIVLSLGGIGIHPALFACALVSVVGVILLLRSKPKPQESQQTSTLRDRIESILKQFNVSDQASLHRLHTEYTQLAEKQSHLEIAIHTLGKQSSLESLQKQSANLSQQLAVLSQTQPDAGLSFTDTEFLALQQKLETLDQACEKATRELHTNQGMVTSLQAPAEQLIEQEEELELLMRQKQEYTDKLDVLELTKTFLSDARDQVMAESSTYLATAAKQYLPAITNGRYTDLRIGSAIEIDVYSKEKNEFIDPHLHVSKGTLDQIYIATRIALHQFLSSGKQAPFFFDDPFVNFDAQRRSAMMHVLQGIAASSQLFLFTHAHEYDQWGQAIELPA